MHRWDDNRNWREKAAQRRGMGTFQSNCPQSGSSQCFHAVYREGNLSGNGESWTLILSCFPHSCWMVILQDLSEMFPRSFFTPHLPRILPSTMAARVRPLHKAFLNRVTVSLQVSLSDLPARPPETCHILTLRTPLQKSCMMQFIPRYTPRGHTQECQLHSCPWQLQTRNKSYVHQQKNVKLTAVRALGLKGKGC